MSIRHVFSVITLLVPLTSCTPEPAPANTSEAAPCPATGARYRLLADPAYRITLEPSPEPNAASDLRLHLHTPQAQRSFAFVIANGYGHTRLLRLPHDAQDDVQDETPLPGFFAFTADMAMLDNPPQSDTPAPAWLFVPDLGPALWYEPHGEGNSGLQEYMPTAMFRLEPCPQR